MKYKILKILKVTIQAGFLGAIIGLIIGLYQLIVEKLVTFSDSIFTDGRNITIILFCILLTLISVFVYIILTRNKDINGSGVPQYELMIHHNYQIKWYKTLPLMFITSIYSYIIGAGLGSEGPSVFLGGMVGKGSNKLFKCDDPNTAAVGGGIGFGCAFGVPLAGMIYTFEESLNHQFNIKLVYKTIVGGIVAIIVKFLIYNHKLIYFENVSNLALKNYWIIIVIALFAFIAGIVFQQLILIVKDFLKKYQNNFLVKYRFFIILVIILLVSVFVNEYNGGGTKIINSLFNYKSIGLLFGILAFRLVFTTLSANSTMSGGLLVPMLLTGAISSSIIYQLLFSNNIVIENDFNVILLCGMLALFANVTKSPLTASALALAFTNYSLAFFPVVLSIIVSCALGKLFKTKDIYENLIIRL